MSEIKLKLEDPKVLKTIIEVFSKFVKEGIIKITPEELSLSAIDASRVATYFFRIPKESFEVYLCHTEKEVPLQLEDLAKVFKRFSAKDTMTLKPDFQAQRLKIIASDTAKTRTFSLAMMNLDAEEIDMKHLSMLEFNSQWTIDVSFLSEALKDAEIYSEIISLQTFSDGRLVMSARGTIGEAEYELGPESLFNYNMSNENSIYSIEYLKPLMKLDSIAENLEISLSTDHPLKMEFNLLEDAGLSCYTAPRVEEEDFNEEEDVDDA